MMKQESSFLARLSTLPALAAVLLAMPLQSCLEPMSVNCASGLLCPAGERCSADQQSCIKTECGDGILQAQFGEVCDDGNISDKDGCSADCKSTETCGNNIIDPGEKCDDGNNDSSDGCSANCRSTEVCGNNIIDAHLGEVCDDNNKDSGDGCSADCKSDETCGNGFLDSSLGEVCDDGNTTNGDGCSADCHSGEKCGNSILDPGEQCDDGNNSDNDNCLTNCLFNTCGDGHQDQQTPILEECDDKGVSERCNFNCTLTKCGDGIVNTSAGEACDDKNDSNCGTCKKDCKNWQEFKSATGIIIIKNPSSVKHDQSITIHDGSKEFVFKFYDKLELPKGDEWIDIWNLDSPDEIANKIKDTINKSAFGSADDRIRVQAVSANWNIVRLENKLAGVDGNKDIKTTSNDGLELIGMSDGTGIYCPAGTGCKSDQDCEPWLQCSKSEGQCQLR
ncbi:DUF4215 domain-containing protein [Archangium violaceum]|uniref:DUF4215 domain-containing protein n=1 Tax=Archangium violaceum TaxID=83451 RepID=UPI000949AA1B|nr:DUF4215 domain-containing protein [Archangium violaceum]